jgi:hypothetical protein
VGIGTGESLRPCSEVFDVNDMAIECTYRPETIRDSSRGTTRTGSSCDFIASMHGGSERFV